jgi:L-asparagine transporter-like permease
MNRKKWTKIIFGLLTILLIQVVLSSLGFDSLNKNTVLVYLIWTLLLTIGLPLVEKQKKKDSANFVLPFLVFTTVQFFFVLIAIVMVNVLLPNEFPNFALQLSLTFFAVLGLQSWVLLEKK